MLPSLQYRGVTLTNPEEMRAAFVNQSRVAKSGLRDCPGVIDGDFLHFNMTSSSGKEEKFTAIAITALNSRTFGKIDLNSAVLEGRIVNMKTEDGVIKQVHLHPIWDKHMEKYDAEVIALRTEVDGPYIWPTENLEIGIGSVKTDENYLGMLKVLGFPVA